MKDQYDKYMKDLAAKVGSKGPQEHTSPRGTPFWMVSPRSIVQKVGAYVYDGNADVVLC
jgi:hypothetical protein